MSLRSAAGKMDDKKTTEHEHLVSEAGNVKSRYNFRTRLANPSQNGVAAAVFSGTDIHIRRSVSAGAKKASQGTLADSTIRNAAASDEKTTKLGATAINKRKRGEEDDTTTIKTKKAKGLEKNSTSGGAVAQASDPTVEVDQGPMVTFHVLIYKVNGQVMWEKTIWPPVTIPRNLPPKAGI